MNENEKQQDKKQAKTHRSRWPGWIWAVPIAAAAIVIWLGIRSFVNQGPEVTVTFQTAGGVKASDTKVKYKDMEVGEVESVTLQKDLKHVDVKLSLNSDMDGQLGPGTRYWIAGGQFSLSNLSAIKSVIAGPYIGIDPRAGKTVHHMAGLDEPPVLKDETPGTSLTLYSDRLGNVDRGTPIFYRDLKVGEVQGYKLEPNDRRFAIEVFVQAPHDKLLHQGTRFWDASAVHLSTGGSGPTVQFQSIPSLFHGAIAFETPSGAAEGPPTHDSDSFTLYPDKDAAENAPDAQGVTYLVTFESQASGLDEGAPVKLMDTRIGSVRQSRLEYDPLNGTLRTKATIVIEPAHLTLAEGGQGWQTDPRAQMDQMLGTLIGQGLRAQLAQSTPVIGEQMVSLTFVPGAKPATLLPGSPPEIPSMPGSNIDSIIAEVGDVVAKVDQMPLPQIADDVHRTTQRIARLSNSPELTNSLRNLDRSLANVDQITAQARERIAPILADVRKAADQAQATLASARTVLASGAQTSNAPESAGVPGTLYELSRAARSLRELSDYLDRHPEALLQGKGSKG